MTLNTSPVFRLATRGSTLALWQANFVGRLLAAQDVKSEVKIIKTEGDRVQDRFLSEFGGKGVFVREIEQALIDNEADLAMHSLKDMPIRSPNLLTVAAYLPRHSPFDVMILKPTHALTSKVASGSVLNLKELSKIKGLRVATSSLRRSMLLKQANSSIVVTPIRGNVDTRIQKLLGSDQIDALLLAEASMDRLSLKGHFHLRLDPEWFVPSPGQGVIAVQSRINEIAHAKAAHLNCDKTKLAVDTERAVLRSLGGDCTMPFGCYVWEAMDAWHAHAVVLGSDGSIAESRASIASMQMCEGKVLAEGTLQELERNGAATILKNLGLDKFRFDLSIQDS
jgi:hydroxymethylbilane synthase